MVSVLMPCFNVARYVAEAAASVKAQSWGRIELIAVDDGSTDGTGDLLAEVAAGWSGPQRVMRVIAQANAGAAAARNTALDLAEGAFVAFLDADDRWRPDLLQRLVARLDAAPDLDMTFPLYRYIDADGDPIGVESDAPLDRYGAVDLMVANPVHSATGVLIRREAARRAGRFDTALRACIDLDFWTRVCALRPRNVGPTDAVLADYRKRDGQITGDWRRMEQNWLAVCAKLDRAGRGLSPRDFRRGRGRHCLFWSTIAYNARDYRSSRRLIVRAWLNDPAFAAGDRLARIRTLSALASLLPERAHLSLRRRFNARHSS